MNWGLTAVGAAVLSAVGALVWSGRASAASSSGNTDAGLDAGGGGGGGGGGGSGRAPIELGPLPTAADVVGDLVTNWGDTPPDLRPLMMQMEEVSKIVGSARVFAVIAYRESQFVTSAHNGDAVKEQAERDSSRRGYDNSKANNPPLRFGEEAAGFGSGGLFGALAPYFLWTGVPEVGKKAPLLRAPPELCFQPRAAAFAACVYMQRLLAHYQIDDVADIKAGWASPSLLKSGRGSKTYHDVRAKFLGDAITLGIDVTVLPKLSAAAWPGVPAVFKALVGSLPPEYA